MDRGQHQPVGPEDPEQHHHQQDDSQKADLQGGHGQNIADEIPIEFGEAAAVHGGDEDAQGHGGGGEHTDDGVGGLAGPLAHISEEQGEHQAQPHGGPDGEGEAAQTADGDACEGRMAQSVGEKAHFPRDDHSAHETEQRGHEKNGEQGVAHKVPPQGLQGEKVANGIP